MRRIVHAYCKRNGTQVSAYERRLGIKTEMEHTRSKKEAECIAEPHWKEHPQYYSKYLIPAEKRMKADLKRRG